MGKIPAVIKKEYKQLVRDIPGLIILFVMPLALIVAVSITQQNAFSRMGQVKTPLLFASEDTGSFSRGLLKHLRQAGSFSVDTLDVGAGAGETARKLVAGGQYQAAVFVPAGCSERLTARIEKPGQQAEDKTDTSSAQVMIYMDPAITDAYRISLGNALRLIILTTETSLTQEMWRSSLPVILDSMLQPVIADYLRQQLVLMEDEFTKELKKRMEYLPPDFRINAGERKIDISLKDALDKGFAQEVDSAREKVLTGIREEFASSGEATLRPSIIQNNVPAFGLFAMFFIVIPLAGSIISERRDGTLRRIKTLPVSYLSLLGGKMAVYLMICFLQLGLLLAAGRWLMPAVFGLEALETGHNYISMFAAALCSSLAAIGFGMLIGVFSGSQSQAGMFGSFMVVILGIFGGIFLPVYLMPEPLKLVSMLSPVRWGIDSFVDIFVRNADLRLIWPDLLRLLSFFIVCSGITLYRYGKA